MWLIWYLYVFFRRWLCFQYVCYELSKIQILSWGKRKRAFGVAKTSSVHFRRGKNRTKSFLNFIFQRLQNYVTWIPDGALVRWICHQCNIGTTWRSLMLNFLPIPSLFSENKYRCSCSWKRLVEGQVVRGGALRQSACGVLCRSAAFDFPQRTF